MGRARSFFIFAVHHSPQSASWGKGYHRILKDIRETYVWCFEKGSYIWLSDQWPSHHIVEPHLSTADPAAYGRRYNRSRRGRLKLAQIDVHVLTCSLRRNEQFRRTDQYQQLNSTLAANSTQISAHLPGFEGGLDHITSIRPANWGGHITIDILYDSSAIG